MENTDRPELSIRYSNPQTLGGRQHPTNVSIDCNSGVYLTAIKPALEAISNGWEKQIISTTIVCDEISPRRDISGRKVCTKIVLYLIEENKPTSRCKVVLHFYHTSCTIQVQGSSLLTCGTCAPVWLTKHFLEPLTLAHTDQNRDAIETMNINIRESALAVLTCIHCNEQINPLASQAKDQELSCSRCKAFFHKKCTDRKKTTGNWKRTPWLCQRCILGTQPLHMSPIPSQDENQDLGPAPRTNQTQAPLQQLADTPRDTPLTRFLALNSQPGAPQDQSCTIIDQDQLYTTSDTATHSSQPGMALSCQVPAPTNDQQSTSLQPARHPAQVVFPTTSGRQRSSNITVQNPEFEFQQTALSACRSTIAQQEAELKRLKEAMVIRNRRILQLESQVGQAAETISARDSPNEPAETSSSTQAILNKLDRLENRLNSFQTNSPPNNIVINACNPNHSPRDSQSATTQTPPSTCACSDSPSYDDQPPTNELSDMSVPSQVL